jgi:uncharacterized protein (TIGR02246 family)
MSPKLAALIALVALSALAPQAAAQQMASAAELAIVNVTVIDVKRGGTLPDHTVLIAGNRIAAMGPAAGVHVPAGVWVVEARGRYLIPGLWDMHVHTADDRITRETFLPLFVANGVTGVRNMHADCFEPCGDDRTALAEVRQWQREIAAGQLVGPRMVAASDVIQGPPAGEPSSVERPTTEAEARALVHLLKERGVDLLKTYSMLPREAYFALADEARKLGISFAGHVPFAVRASEASDAGQRSFEHLYGFYEECSEREDELRPDLIASWGAPGSADTLLLLTESFSEEKCAALHARLIANNTWVVPTLIVLEEMGRIGDDLWREDPRLRYVTAEERVYWAESLRHAASISSGGLATAGRISQWQHQVVAAMREAGVLILAGSDAGHALAFPGFGLHDELELLVEVGLTPAEALRAATLSAAEYLEATDSLGTVATGQLADLVLLDANPLDDIRNTRRIRAVVLDGRYFDRSELDEVLAGVELAARESVVHVAPPTGRKEADRASILAALEQVRPGGTVQFAQGTYLVGEIISVTVPEVNLLGHPEGTTLRGCEWEDFQDMDQSMLTCNGLELAGVRQAVRGITFENAFWALHLGCCWNERRMYEWTDGSTFEGPVVRRTGGGHLVEHNTFRSAGSGLRANGDWTEPAVVRHNRFIDNWHAVSINGHTVHLLDNHISVPEPARVPFTGFPWDGIKISPPPPAWGEEGKPLHCTGNVIEGNHVEGHLDGIRIEVYFPNTACRDNVVRDNTVIVARHRNPDPAQFNLADPSDSTFVGVPISILNDPMAFGEAGPGHESVVEGNVIERNRIVGGEGLGVQVLHASRNRIADNEISGIVRRSPFPGNAMGTWGARGLAPPWAEGNGAGIWLSPGSEENEIVGNVFEDVASYAVVIEGDRNRVETRSASDAVHDLGGGNQVSGPAAPPAAEVHALMEQFIAGLNDESPGRVARFFAGDATLTVSGSAVIAGREAIVQQFLRPNVARIRGMRLTSMEMAVAEGRVTVSSAYAARLAPSADTAHAHLSTIWTHQPDGSWLIAASTFELPAVSEDGPVRSRYFHSDGLRLHYLDFGGEGIPVVLTPVRDRTAYSFVEFAEWFSRRNRVLAITSRGSGESEGELEETFDLVAAARDVIALLDAVSIERAVVIPWWWAQLGIYLAEQHPERMSGLVFPAGGPGPDWISLWDEDPTGVLEMAPRLFSAQDGEDPDEAMLKLRSRPRYEASYLRTTGSLDIPALMLVSQTAEAEVADRWQGDLALARRVAADPLSAPDSLARAFYLRLAADAELQEDVRAVYRDLVAPAAETAETAFRRAFGERLHIVPVDDHALVYGYRDAPDLIYPHIRDFLDEVSTYEKSRSEAPPAGRVGPSNQK